MTNSDLGNLLNRLDGEPADSLESDTLEFKSWNPHGPAHKTQLRDIREEVVALANANGGTIVLGVADRKRTRSEAIHGVGELDPRSVRRDIYDGTEPHILVEIDELREPEGRLLAIKVPRGLPPHTTTEGVAKLRIGKDSKPLTGSGLVQLLVTRGHHDPTAETLPDVSVGNLDRTEIERIRQFANQAQKPELAGLGDQELLEALDLVQEGEVTLAAVLLVGQVSTIRRHVPRHELIISRQHRATNYDFRRDLHGPLFALLDDLQNILTANLRIGSVPLSDFRQLELPDISWWVAREATLNAVVHRDYFLNQSTHFSLLPGRIEIESPGGLVGGITVNNILRHPPVRRNPLLADALQTVGFVNRAGLGVDRIYHESLSLGKDLPRYEADESRVKLILPTITRPGFARFVHDISGQGGAPSLEDLIILRVLTNRVSLDRWTTKDLLQNSEDHAASALASLRERGFLVAHGRGRGTTYRLARRYAESLGHQEISKDEVWIDQESVRLRILHILSDRGRVTNSEVQRISGFSRSQVLNLMRSLRSEGLINVKGRGRAAHYVLASPLE